MKIGASVFDIMNTSLEENLEFFDNNKHIDYVELCHDYPYENMNDNKELIDLLNSYSLKYTIHSPLIDTNIASLNSTIVEASISEMKGSIDLANKIDSDIVVIHPGKISFQAIGQEEKVYEIAKNSLKEIGKYGEDCGVYPCIENMPNIEGFMYKDINHLNQTLEELDLPMTLDIGHAHHAGFSPKEIYFDRIKHIHVHNNYGDDDTHNQLNEGTFNVNEFFDIFIDKKYDGIYMLEMFNKDFIEKSIEYLKENKYI